MRSSIRVAPTVSNGGRHCKSSATGADTEVRQVERWHPPCTQPVAMKSSPAPVLLLTEVFERHENAIEVLKAES